MTARTLRQMAELGTGPDARRPVAPHAPLFASVHSALMFAFTFSENQHARAAACEALLLQFAKGRYAQEAESVARILVEPRGLVALDGATQSGMIQAAVSRLHAVPRAAIYARFDIMERESRITGKKAPSRARREAWQALAIHTSNSLALDSDRTQYAVQACYGADIRAKVIEGSESFLQCKRSQAFDILRRVKSVINHVEQRGFDELEPRFRRGGVIE